MVISLGHPLQQYTATKTAKQIDQIHFHTGMSLSTIAIILASLSTILLNMTGLYDWVEGKRKGKAKASDAQ